MNKKKLAVPLTLVWVLVTLLAMGWQSAPALGQSAAPSAPLITGPIATPAPATPAPSPGATLTPTPTPIPASTATAQPAPQEAADPQGVVIPLFETDQTLIMPRNTLSYWFFLPKGVALSEECTLTLHYTYSLTFIETLSAFTVSMNNTPLESQGIVEEGEQDVTWVISFDASLMTPGAYNELRFDSVQRSIEGECADIDNPTNWLILRKESTLTLGFEPSASPDISDFYALFLEMFSDPFSIAYDFVLGDRQDVDQIGAMLGIANATGMYYPSRTYVRYQVTDAPGAEPGNSVYIGPPPDASAQTAPEAATLSMTGATAAEPYYLASVLGTSPQAFQKASAFFSNRTMLESIQRSSVVLITDIATHSLRQVVQLNDSGLYTFAQMGLSDITLAGAFHQRTSLSFIQPGGVMGGPGSYIDLRFRHSAALLSDRSQISVLINGVPISSTKLTVANTDGGNLMVPIPQSALQSPEIQIDIECYHYLGRIDCTKEYDDVAWTVIDAEESKICLVKSDEAIRPTLYRFPFFYNAQSSAVTLYLPGDPDPQRLAAAAQLSARAGQNTAMCFQWDVRQAYDAQASQAGTLIFFARSDQAALPAEIAAALPIAPSEQGYQIQEGLMITPEMLDGKAILQALRSPWDFYQQAYVILYDSEQSLENLRLLLSDNAKLTALDGQVALVGKGASLQLFFTGPEVADSDTVPMTFTDYIKKVENLTGLAWWMLVAILAVILMVVVLLIRLIRRKASEYKNAADKHKREQGFAKPEEPSEGDQDAP